MSKVITGGLPTKAKYQTIVEDIQLILDLDPVVYSDGEVVDLVQAYINQYKLTEAEKVKLSGRY